MNVIIIGNGIAGLTVAQELFNSQRKDIKIDIFTSEPWFHYNRPQLPRFIGEQEYTIDKVFGPYDEYWYRKRMFNLHLSEEVTKVDLEKKAVYTSVGSYSFDKIVFATGARCRVPPIEGRNLENFFVLRNLSEAIIIKNKLREVNSVCIVGGGILGLEIAYNISKQVKKVHVVETNLFLLHKQLDQEGGKILKEILEKNGLIFHLNTGVLKIKGDNNGKISQFILNNGEIIAVDLVIASIGIVSNTEIAKKAGLEINRGIVVNDYLETSAGEDIYAVGDCAEYKGIIYGLRYPAVEQAKVAAQNILKTKSLKYEGSKVSTVLKVADVFVTSINYNAEECIQSSDKIIKYLSNKNYLKLFLRKNKVYAGLIIGYKKVIPLIKKIINEELPFSEYKEKIEQIVGRN